MGFQVILTPQSQKDLQSIVAFIARNNPERAKSFGNELIDKALFLGTLSLRGRVTPELNDPNVREIVHSPYRIIYEVLDEKFMCCGFGTERGENSNRNNQRY